MEKKFLIITKSKLIESTLSQLKDKLLFLRKQNIEYSVLEV